MKSPDRASGPSGIHSTHNSIGLFLLLLLPAFITYFILFHFATPLPMLDDFPEIISFALKLHNATTFAAKLSAILFTQTGPYKLIFLHGLVAIQLFLFKHLNFAVLVLVGDLTVTGMFFLLARNTNLSDGRGDARWLRLLPVSLLLFGLNYAEAVDWALGSLQQLTGIFFCLAAFHFLVKSAARPRSFVAACIFALLAVSSNASGLLIFPVGLLFLILQTSRFRSPRTQHLGTYRRFLYPILWTGLMAASSILYFFHINSEGLTGHASLGSKFLFFLMFCGGSFENMHHRPIPYLSAAVGCFILITFLFSIRNRYDRTHPFFFFTTLWLVATAALVARTRILLGLELSLSGRYKIYCALLLIFCYEYLLDRYILATPSSSDARANYSGNASMRRFLMFSILCASVIFCISEAVGAKFLYTRLARVQAAHTRYVNSGGQLSPMFIVTEHLTPQDLALEEQAREELNRAIALGIYIPPSH